VASFGACLVVRADTNWEALRPKNSKRQRSQRDGAAADPT